MSMNQKGLIKLCDLWKLRTSEGKVYYFSPLGWSADLFLFPHTCQEWCGDEKPDLILYIGKREKKEKSEKRESDYKIPF